MILKLLMLSGRRWGHRYITESVCDY